MVVCAEPHRDREARPQPYTESFFHPLMDEEDDAPAQGDGGVPLTGAMAARIGDLLERRREREEGSTDAQL